jgi:F-type H+-transporting ATPase subunit a
VASHTATETTEAATHGAEATAAHGGDVVAHGADAAHDAGGLVFHPLDQFIVKPLFGDGAVHWYTPTNVTLWLALAVLCVVLLFVVGSRGRATIPSRVQSVGELFYGFTHKMVEDVCGKEGLKYFPYVMTLFVFILFANFLGLLPMSFATTSHIAVTAVLGFGVFFGVTILGFVLKLFWMSEAPLFLRPIIAVIELISYFVRPVSHSVRLAGNITAGHAVMKVFAAFAGLAIVSPVSILAITAIYGLEVLVAGIQAYVFAILTCVYLKDALHPAH